MHQHFRSLKFGAGLWTTCRDLWRDTNGASAVEYGLMVGFISVAIMGTMAAIGTSIGDVFTTLSDVLNPPE